MCSPGSCLPLGQAQSSYLGRCTSSTSPPLSLRTTTAPAATTSAPRAGTGTEGRSFGAMRIVSPAVEHLGKSEDEVVAGRGRTIALTVILVVVLGTLVTVGARFWADRNRTDLRRALDVVPSSTLRLSFTDWSAVRSAL